MSETALDFKNSRGLTLKGVLHRPETPRTDGLGAVLCHGMLSTKDSRKHIANAERLLGLGLPVFRFDFSGQGESEGDPALITYSNGVDDLLSALNLMEANGITRFLLVGSSMGAGISILTAGLVPEKIAGLCLMASIVLTAQLYEEMSEDARAQWQKSGLLDFEGRQVRFELVEDAKKLDLGERLEAFGGPVLFVHGTEDELIPYRRVATFAARHSGTTELVFIEGADHRFSRDADRAVLSDHIARFVATNVLIDKSNGGA